jgi:hypothetical protein
MKLFLLGVMVAYTPSLLVLAYLLLRGEVGSDASSLS